MLKFIQLTNNQCYNFSFSGKFFLFRVCFSVFGGAKTGKIGPLFYFFSTYTSLVISTSVLPLFYHFYGKTMKEHCENRIIKEVPGETSILIY